MFTLPMGHAKSSSQISRLEETVLVFSSNGMLLWLYPPFITPLGNGEKFRKAYQRKRKEKLMMHYYSFKRGNNKGFPIRSVWAGSIAGI
ncbi:hypothetical protein CEXT_229251 [Caerostris extrusa]|uniref:Uncharacterized protein n=1 Tax=Caerostris extrusa TaxID=172846 RepID=A0AAV4NPL3_CAEEX|nr:hypothetical protein CEXT_229251 [Caerostris extrusa]